jgi:hypothetical protein
MRLRAVEDAWLAVRQQATAIGIGRFSFKSSAGAGWTITFVLDVDFRRVASAGRTVRLPERA